MGIDDYYMTRTQEPPENVTTDEEDALKEVAERSGMSVEGLKEMREAAGIDE